MKKMILVPLLSLFILSVSHADVDWNRKMIKSKIVQLAKSFEGQGDPDFSKQNAFTPLVQELLAIAPQPPVEDRLDVLAGVWRQVWGPYDYRNDDRGIDPELGIEEIYQVVSREGYYYNVSYLYKNGDKNKKRIGLLRGEYKLSKDDPNTLNVKFTNYPGASSKSDGLQLWQLPALAELGTLPNKITIVPSFLVKIFFGGGTLREVYTDDDLRILYGASKRYPENDSIYIMTRVR